MIVDAAIKTKDSKVYTGRRHSDIILKNKKSEFIFRIQGFVNDKNEFLTRHEAHIEAQNCGQVKDKLLDLY